jgi:hypothetical protein
VRKNDPGALRIFRLIYVVFILSASAQTLIGAPHGDEHAVILAAVEIVAALLFLRRDCEIAACAVLLVIYAIATGLSAVYGDWSLRFIYYGATAVFITYLSRRLQSDNALGQ